jgi:hypothetical protein
VSGGRAAMVLGKVEKLPDSNSPSYESPLRKIHFPRLRVIRISHEDIMKDGIQFSKPHAIPVSEG